MTVRYFFGSFDDCMKRQKRFIKSCKDSGFECITSVSIFANRGVPGRLGMLKPLDRVEENLYRMFHKWKFSLPTRTLNVTREVYLLRVQY